MELNSSSLIRFQCIVHDSGVLLSKSWNFYKLKWGDLNYGGEPISQNVWIISSPLLYFNFKSCMNPNSSSFIRFQGISPDTGVLFHEPWNFYKLKRGHLISWGEPILHNVWIIWSPLLCFNFKSFMNPNSSLFIRFQCIGHVARVLFLEPWNFYKLKRGGPTLYGEPILQKVWIIWSPPFCFLILKVLWSQILRH